MLYDADAVHAMAARPEAELYQAHLDVFLDPNDPAVARQAAKDGIPHPFITAAQASPTYALIAQWKLALPLHPEFRTLPMVWYIPPASPQKPENQTGDALDHMRIPPRYLANLFTAGDEAPVRSALHKLLALRSYMRQRTFGGEESAQCLESAGLDPKTAEAMYRLLAVARYEDRFVIPTVRRENAPGEDVEALKGAAGYPDNCPCGVQFKGGQA